MIFNPPPSAASGDNSESVRALYSYLYGMAEQLNAALGTLESQQTRTSETISALGGGAGVVDAKISDNYQQVKSLIIKSGEIIRNELDQIVSRFGQDYLTVDAFGTFEETLSDTITQTATGVLHAFNYDSTLRSFDDALSAIQTAQNHSEQYIKIGVVKFDALGNPVVGVAVGNELTTANGAITSASMYAVFTADRLSFYKNGVEMAYLSNNTLYVSSVELTDHMTLSNWRIDDSNGFTVRWIGA